MSENNKFLYHCERCSALFKSTIINKEDIRCDVCGENPVRSKFNSMPVMPPSQQPRQRTRHGIPGMDEADFLSMQKKKKRTKWTIICILWIMGLAGVLFSVSKLNKEAEVASIKNDQLDNEDKDYFIRKKTAYNKCINRFSSFVSANIINTKSTHILNGSELVLDIDRYYASNFMNNQLTSSRHLNFRLIEEKNSTKAELLLEYTPQSDKKSSSFKFEILFWKQGEEWLIDWPHFVRLGEMSWFRFGENKTKNTPKKFKLYAREPATGSISISGYSEYKFSEALNNSNKPSQLPQPVFVKHQTKARSTLNKQFKLLRERRRKKLNKDDVFRTFDPTESIRLDVTIDFEDIEGQTVMVLKEIHRLDWQSPPKQN